MRLREMDRILEIEQASFGAEAYDRKLFAEYFHTCGELFLTAERRGRIWGYMITCIGGRQAEGGAELVSVAVEPAARGTGAASALMDSTLRRLRRRGIARVHLMVMTTNRAARAFYEKYGFRKLRRVPRYYENGTDGLRMAKEL